MAHRARRLRSYRGRSRKGTILLIVALILLAAVGYGIFWLFDHITLNADGSVTVNMPWGVTTPPPAPPPTDPSEITDITIVTPSTMPESLEPDPTASPTPTPTPSPTVAPELRMVYVSQAHLSAVAELEAIVQQARGIGATTLVLDYKADSGVVLTDEMVASARGRLGSEFQLIARLSVFLDDLMPTKHGTWGVKHTSGVNWINTSGRWLNPYRAEAIDYVLGCISHAAELGFDGVLLDNLAFPWYGSIGKISYGADADTPRHTAINAFIESVTALDSKLPIGTVALEETAELGRSDTGGQILSELIRQFDFVVTGYLDPNGNPPNGLLPLIEEGYSEDFRTRTANRPGGLYWAIDN